MEVLRSIDDLKELGAPAYLAIGVFDGVHLGHQAVIESALAASGEEGGVAVVVTFDPHPVSVLQPERAPRLLASTQHKLLLLKKSGIESVLVLPFDEAFSQLSGEEFILALVEACRPLKQISVGNEWSFGRGRSGNIRLLEELGAKHGFRVVGVAAVKVGDEVVSSTMVREAVCQGDFERAAAFLGREYTVLGTVIEGEHLGRKLGFPTANLTVHNEQLPPSGVYVVRAVLGSRDLWGVGNLGFRPTVTGGDAKRMLEIHLLDYHEDIYGADMEVFFVKFLRPETKFENVHALREQIEKDVALAKEIVGS